MPAIYEYPHIVHDDEIDALGHAGNVAYVAWMQDAAIAHSSAQGWSGDAYRTLGAGWVVRRHEIDYFQPAFAGDELLIRTWVSATTKVTSQRRYEIRRRADDQVLVAAVTQWVFIDHAKRSPCRIPVEVASAFTVVADPALAHNPT